MGERFNLDAPIGGAEEPKVRTRFDPASALRTDVADPSSPPGLFTGPTPASRKEQLKNLGKGAVEGIFRSPLVRINPAAEHVLEPITLLAGLEKGAPIDETPPGTARSVGRFAGQFAPELAVLGPVFRAGTVMADALMSRMSLRAATALASEGAAQMGALPLGVRAARMGGRASTFGLEQTGAGLAEGESFEEAGMRGLQGAGAVLAFEGGASAIFRLFSRMPSFMPTGAKIEQAQRIIDKVDERIMAGVDGFAKQVAKEGPFSPALVKTARAKHAQQIQLTDRKALLEKYKINKRAGLHEKAAAAMEAQGQRLQEESIRHNKNVVKLEPKIIETQLQADLLESSLAPLGASSKAVRARLTSLRKRQAGLAKAAQEKGMASLAARRVARSEPALADYFSVGPRADGSTGQTDRWIQQQIAKFLRSPDATLRKQGFAGVMASKLGMEASEEASAMRAAYQKKFSDLFGELSDAVGRSRAKKLLSPSGKFANPILEAFETPGGGYPLIEARFGPKVSEIWRRIMGTVDELYGSAETIGALPRISKEMARAAGVENYFPQFRVVSTEEASDMAIRNFQRLLRSRGRDVEFERARVLLEKIQQEKNQGLPSVGSIDFWRTVPGTTAEKNAGHFPMVDDPLHAVLRYADSISHRVAYGKRFGPNGELSTGFIEAAKKEGADLALMHTMMDNIMGRKLHSQVTNSVVSSLQSLQIVSKLGLAFIPNASQTINTIVFNGFQSTLRGFVDLRRRGGKAELAEALGIFRSSTEFLGQGISGLQGGLPQRIASGFLDVSLFTPVERFNRLLAGSAARANARKMAAQLMAGRLKGSTLATARRKMNSIGLDLDKIATRGSMTTEEELIAVRQGARLTQFLPDNLSLPTAWQHPAGRVLTQFKTFIFNQAKFIRDQVFREAANGNYKPLAYFLSLYPVAGEAVNNSVATFTGRERDSDGVQQLVENFAAVGAFGLAYNAAMSAYFDDTASVLLGPTVTTATDLVGILGSSTGDALEGDFETLSESMLREAARLPSVKLGMMYGSGIIGIAEIAAQLGGVEEETSFNLDELEYRGTEENF